MAFAIVRHRHALAAGAVLATITLFVASIPAAASVHGSAAAGSSRRVTYQGYVFEIPRAWPVISLAAHPATCVRFDRHALYLGRPGTAQACPSGPVGSTEAVLAEPASAGQTGAAQTGDALAGGQRPGTGRAVTTEDPVSHRIVATAPRIMVTATYAAGRAQILAILKSAGLPSPVVQNPAEVQASKSVPTVPLSATSFTGLGFDACAAPGPKAMHAWLAHSGYQAAGIYIGGSDRACAQPNLTAAWLSQQAAAGWHFIPLYVGPQVAYKGQVTAARVQGTAAAQDAAVQAQLLGLGPGTPIYYDMEAFPPNRNQAALKFFSSWTTELHSLGYKAGVYSSSDSGITDMVTNYTNPAFTMPDVIDDAWWNGVADTTDPNVPATDWANHTRVHQFSGDVTETHGGYTISIDQDYLDVQLGGGSGGGGGGNPAARQSSQAVSTAGRVVYAFFAGTDRALWYTRYRPHHGWSAPARLTGSLAGQPSAVAAVAGVTVFYRASNGGLRYLASGGGGWSAPHMLHMGALGSGPRAVSTSGGDIAVFWRGKDPGQLWAASYAPGHGWAGPRHLASGLASQPSPAVSGSGTVSVFWKATDGRMWFVSRGTGGAWSAPSRLNMGRLRTGPRATGQGGGQVGVFWGGRSRGSVRRATYTGGGWSGASRAGTGMSGEPVVVASASRTESAFWKGRGAKLWRATSRGGASWDAAAPLPLGKVGGGLFAAGQSNGVVDVFWRGPAGHHLWHSRYYPHGSSWTHPRDLGGSMGLGGGPGAFRGRPAQAAPGRPARHAGACGA
jgi:hypothetical protein